MVYIIKAINGCGLPLLQTQPWPSEASFGYCVPGRLHVDLTTTEACGLSPGPSRGPRPWPWTLLWMKMIFFANIEWYHGDIVKCTLVDG